MEKNIIEEESKLGNKKNNSKKNHSFFDHLKNPTIDNNRIKAKNIFLSLPKLNIRENRINKSFLKTLNLSIKHKRNRTIDTLYSDNIIKYESTTPSMLNKRKKEFINIAIIDNNNKNKIQKINRFTIILENPQSKKIHQNHFKSNFNTTFKNYQKNNNLKETNQLRPKINKSTEQKNSKIKINPILKKPSIDYIAPIFKNTKTYFFKEEPNLKLLSIGDLMIMQAKKKIRIKNDNKMGNKSEENTSKSYLKIGSKFSGKEKMKNLEERNAFYTKIKLLYDENRQNKLKRKYVRIRNVHDVLENFKNRRFESCRKVIKQTLLDVKKEKNLIVDFFDNYKKVFDEYDDWDDPKNKDNLFNN